MHGEGLNELTKQYQLVSQCWEDHRLAVRRRMTVERALGVLRLVQEKASKYKNGRRLARMAYNLSEAIVKRQEDPVEVARVPLRLVTATIK